MQLIGEFLHDVMNMTDWPARWACGKWSSFHGWLYIISSLAIWAAYFAIPLIIFLFLRKQKEVPFKRVFWLFILFILACGTTHFIDATMFWYPAYRIMAVLLFITATISWITVLGLLKMLPDALKLKSPNQLENIIYQRTFELENSNSHLKKINSDMDSFVYAASHDLKSPLNNIEALTNMIETDVANGNSPDKEAIARIKDSVHKLKNTINNLSEVARVQKDPYDDVETLFVSEILNEVLTENQELFEKTKIEVRTDFQTKTLVYSRVGLKSILYNLVTNAAKYSSPKRSPVIDIKTSKSEGKIFLQVTDNGLGLDLSKHGDKVFKIFRRFHDHVEGSGIGLYTIKNIVEGKGGSIHIDSTLDVGTTFIVDLGN